MLDVRFDDATGRVVADTAELEAEEVVEVDAVLLLLSLRECPGEGHATV